MRNLGVPWRLIVMNHDAVSHEDWASWSMARASWRVPSAAESPRSIAASSATRSDSPAGRSWSASGRARLLADDPLAARVAGHLGQVGHADDLMVPRQLGQRLAQRRAQAAADAGVDLVEDQRRHPVDHASTVLAASVTSRQLAARGDLAERPGDLARVGRKSISTRSAPDSGGEARSGRRPGRASRPRRSAGPAPGPAA